MAVGEKGRGKSETTLSRGKLTLTSVVRRPFVVSGRGCSFGRVEWVIQSAEILTEEGKGLKKGRI